MDKGHLIEQTINFVKETLKDAEGGHDWLHIERVWNTAKAICKEEQADLFIVELAALLHDIADSKFNSGDEEIGPITAYNFLISKGIDQKTAFHVEQIIRFMSFKSSFTNPSFSSLEMKVVQDADRLDAIGAIGIARAFSYGGHKKREIYNPDVPPSLQMTKDEYKNNAGPTINHFYEKLLLLKDKMNTSTGKRMAAERHKFMEDYLKQFYAEWNGEK